MAQQRAILLSGEHATLPEAELRALLCVHDPGALVTRHGLVARITPGNEDRTDAALGRMALAHEWGILWGCEADSPEGLARLAHQVTGNSTGKGSAAVEVERRGLEKSPNHQLVARALGASLVQKGHSIDLREPDVTVFAWLIDDMAWVGLRRGRLDRSQHELRTSQQREHFSPVSLHPRRAASLLHLARVPLGGRIYDPFCGTGAFVLEAALEGYDAWGSDLDAFMVQGTLQTLADAADAPLAGAVFVADVADAPGLMERVDAIVTDLPYGRASSTAGEAPDRLYERAFSAFAALLSPGSLAVIGHDEAALVDPITRHGFRVVERHSERVHRSMTRHFAVVMRMPGVQAPA